MAPTVNPSFPDYESPLRAGRPVLYAVVHTAECDEYDGADNAISSYLARSPNSSIHTSIDNNSVTPSVPEDRVAWAASNPLINNFALQAEWTGRAGQGASGWDDDFSRGQMTIASWLYARWANENHIPIVHGTPEDLRNGVPGFYGHVDSTRAFNNPDGHYDPGPTFPWDRFLDMTRQAAGTPNLFPPTPTPPEENEEDDMPKVLLKDEKNGKVFYCQGIFKHYLTDPAYIATLKFLGVEDRTATPSSKLLDCLAEV